MNDLNEYQERAFALALPTTRNLTYMVLGLANEAGEVAGKLKKLIRGDVSAAETEALIRDELGDVMWYVGGTAKMISTTLEELATLNLQKLESRKERGKLQGDGDTR